MARGSWPLSLPLRRDWCHHFRQLALDRRASSREARMSWRKEIRRCSYCRSEYRPQREAQCYCSRDCKRAAEYGRERFRAGTKGRRKRRLEASDKLPGTLVAGSVRNGPFFLIETEPCKGTKPPHSASFEHWPRCKVCNRWQLLPRDGFPRHMFCLAVRKRAAIELELAA